MQSGAILEPVQPDRGTAGPDVEKAVWSTAYVNDLPDSSFAYIEPGGKKDEEGKTAPRSLRHLPYKDKDGKPDPAHVRNALARLPQTKISDAAKAEARKKLVAAAKELGIEVSDEKEAKKMGTEEGCNKEGLPTDGPGESKALDPEDEASHAQAMQKLLEQLQALVPGLKEVIGVEEQEVSEGETQDEPEVEELKDALQGVAEAMQALAAALNQERREAGMGKDITSASGLSTYNIDATHARHRMKKGAVPDVKKVGRKMAADRLNKLNQAVAQFKDALAAIEELMKELGASSFEGGDEDLGPDEGGGGTVRQTRHGTPADKGKEMGTAMKGAGLFDLGAVVGEAVAAALVKAGLVHQQSTKEQADTGAARTDAQAAVVADIRKSLQEIDKRLRGIENQAAPAQAVQTVVVDRKHALDPDVKKTYQGTVSKLAEQVASLGQEEREQLAAEIIKAIHGKK